MVRHRKTHRRGGFAKGGFLKHGIMPTFGSGIMGMAVSAAIGYAAVKFVNPRLPQIVPMQGLAVATVAGGLPGAVGGFLAGGVGGSSSGGYL